MTTSTTADARANARAMIERALTPEKGQGGIVAAFDQLESRLRRYGPDLTVDDLDDIRAWLVAHIDADLRAPRAARPRPRLVRHQCLTPRRRRGGSTAAAATPTSCDGEQADGVTWILSNGIPKPALIGWAANTTAGYAIDHWDELTELKSSERLRKLEKARFGDNDAALVRGTQVHALAQQLASGEEVDVPEHLLGHVDTYLAVHPRLAARGSHRRKHRRRTAAAGTWAPSTSSPASTTGRRWLLDFKTTASGIWPEIRLQLAGYRNADFYIDDHGDEQPMPSVDQAGCIWLRADGYDLIPVDAGPETFRIFLYAQQVARFTSQPRERYVLEALQPREGAA